MGGIYKKAYNKIFKAAGFTLIELLIVIAILAILSAIAISKFTGAKTLAKNKVDEANASILTGIAHKMRAENGSFPEETDWGTFFTEFSNTSYLDKDIEIQNKSNIFEYDESTGKVTVIALSTEPSPTEPSTKPPTLNSIINSITPVSFTFYPASIETNPILNVPSISGVDFKFTKIEGKGTGNAEIQIIEGGKKANIIRNNGSSAKEFTLTLQVTRGNEAPVSRNFTVVIPGDNTKDKLAIEIR